MAAKIGGGGGGKYAIEQNSEINVTPFVDVMLVLLIIFMVAAPLTTRPSRSTSPSRATETCSSATVKPTWGPWVTICVA